MSIASAAASAVSMSHEKEAENISSLPSQQRLFAQQHASAAGSSPSNDNGTGSSLQKSTIYKRHQARLRRSMSLRDDPRPSVVRVLSLLPGFRMVIPQYDPSLASEKNSAPAAALPLSMATSAAFSEDTVFVSGDVGSSSSSSSSSPFASAAASSASASTVTPLHTMVAAAVAASAANGFFRNSAAQASTQLFASGGALSAGVKRNPFSMPPAAAAPPTTASPLSFAITQSGVLAVNPTGAAAPQPSVGNALQSSAATKAVPRQSAVVLARSVAATSAIFTARAMAQQQTGGDSVLSNIAAGLVAGGAATLAAKPATIPTTHMMPSNLSAVSCVSSATATTTAIPSSTLAAREMVAAFLYFQLYDITRATIAPTHEQTMTSVATTSAVAGAIAGSLAQGVRSSMHRSGGVIRNAAVAAPKHALLFATYDTLLHAMQMSPNNE